MEPPATPSATRVFISYARADTAAAEALRSALVAAGVGAYLDRHDIAAGEDWRERLGRLIEAADAVVFLVSPTSVASKMCDWEINRAELLGKRIVPVVCRDAPAQEVPERLSRLNYVFMRTPAEADGALPALEAALKVDVAWVRAHTSYGELAADWDRGGRPSHLLLRGARIDEAERWRDGRPPTAPRVTPQQGAFIAASRRAAVGRQRLWVVGSLSVAVVAVGLSVFAWQQRQTAEARRVEVSAALATSDLRRGTSLVAEPETEREGIAYLARSARAGDLRAQTRLWTLLQQRSFWVPAGQEPASAPAAAPSLPPEVAARFATVELDGQRVQAHNVVLSPDGGRVFVTTGGVDDAALDPVRVRVYQHDGTPVVDWFAPPYDGAHYLAFARGSFSPQGRYLAVEAQGWREASYLVVYDLEEPELTSSRVWVGGLVPQAQFASFVSVRLVHKPGEMDADGPPLLLVGSERGDASAWRNEGGTYVEVARNAHRAAVTRVMTDPAQEWLMSADADRRVRVARLQDGAPVGAPIQIDEDVSGLARGGPAELDVTTAAGVTERFLLVSPLSLSYTGRMPASDALAKEQQRCLKPGGELASLDYGDGVVLRLAGPRQVEVEQAGVAARSPVLASDVVVTCASDDRQIVSVTTADFRTVLWTQDFRQAMGPPLDERPLNTGSRVADTTDWVQVDRERKRALVRSSFWDPPNIEYAWITVWDVAAGLPLADRTLFIDDVGGEGVITSASFDPQSGELAYLAWRQPPSRGLGLDVPAALGELLPSYVEAIGGRVVNADGLLEPITDRAERLAAGRAAVERYLAGRITPP